MVWYITSINADVARTTLLIKPKSEIVNPTGALGGNYVLAFPGLGYVTLTDNGNTVPGGDWSVKFSGATNGAGNWFYNGSNGQANITIDATGSYTVSGGSGTPVQGKLTAWPV